MSHEKRHFLFLQGMPSAFFRHLADELAARGHKVSAIRLCAGDRLFWRGPDAHDYTGRIEDWPEHVAGFLARHRVTDLVLLGEQRRYHREAVAAAQAGGVRVTVTDFGYLRPDWITLEADGMGGTSRFPRDPAAIRRLAAGARPPAPGRVYADSDLAMAAGDLLHSFANVFFWWLHPHYRQSDRRPHPLVYFPATGLRLLATRFGRARARRLLAGVRPPYFVFPLQLEHDFQIVAYSPFDTMDQAIERVLASFAAHAAPETRLVVKVHPWDPGLKAWGRRVRRRAAAHRLDGRVVCVDGGDLDALAAGSEGMVTVNSTSGLKALHLGRPVAVLGQAVYDVPGLTFQGGLDRFWCEAAPPDAGLADALLAALAATIQIRGVFFREPGMSAAVQAAARRLAEGTVGQPLQADWPRNQAAERAMASS